MGLGGVGGSEKRRENASALRGGLGPQLLRVLSRHRHTPGPAAGAPLSRIFSLKETTLTCSAGPAASAGSPFFLPFLPFLPFLQRLISCLFLVSPAATPPMTSGAVETSCPPDPLASGSCCFLSLLTRHDAQLRATRQVLLPSCPTEAPSPGARLPIDMPVPACF